MKRDASDGQIASSYRKLAVKYHPDSNPGDAEAVEKFKEAAEAYEVLSDPEKRARYDRFGHAGRRAVGRTQFHDVETSSRPSATSSARCSAASAAAAGACAAGPTSGPT